MLSAPARGGRPIPWCELRVGATLPSRRGLETFAFGHPGGHMNDSLRGGDNADTSVGVFASLSMQYQF